MCGTECFNKKQNLLCDCCNEVATYCTEAQCVGIIGDQGKRAALGLWLHCKVTTVSSLHVHIE